MNLDFSDNFVVTTDGSANLIVTTKDGVPVSWLDANFRAWNAALPTPYVFGPKQQAVLNSIIALKTYAASTPQQTAALGIIAQQDTLNRAVIAAINFLWQGSN